MSETDGQPRELWLYLKPDIACGVEEHEKQQAAAIAACMAPPPGLWVGPGSYLMLKQA